MGLWDISELIQKYSSEVEFHLLPLGTLEKFFDYQEVLLFGLFEDFKRLRDGKFSDRQIGFLQNTFEGSSQSNQRHRRSRSRSNSVCSAQWGQELKSLITSPEYDSSSNLNPNEINNVTNSRLRRNDTSCVFTADFVNNERLPCRNGLSNLFLGHSEQLHEQQQQEANANDSLMMAYWNKKGAAMLEDYQRNCASSSGVFNSDAVAVLQVYTMMAYKQIQGRFHEFMISVLGMTVFDGAELWLSGSEGEQEVRSLSSDVTAITT